MYYIIYSSPLLEVVITWILQWIHVGVTLGLISELVDLVTVVRTIQSLDTSLPHPCCISVGHYDSHSNSLHAQ